MFKDFETIFAFLLNSLTDHYLSQFLVRLVVFLSDDKLILLLLFETDDFSILGFETSNFPFSRPVRRSFLMFVCLLGEEAINKHSSYAAQEYETIGRLLVEYYIGRLLVAYWSTVVYSNIICVLKSVRGS